MIRTEGSFQCLAKGRYSTLARLTSGRKSRRAGRDKPTLPAEPQSAKTLRHQVSQHCTRPVSSNEVAARKAFDAAEEHYKAVKATVDTWGGDVQAWIKDIKSAQQELRNDPAAPKERVAFLVRRLDNAKQHKTLARASLKEADEARKVAFRGLCDALDIPHSTSKLTKDPTKAPGP